MYKYCKMQVPLDIGSKAGATEIVVYYSRTVRIAFMFTYCIFMQVSVTYLDECEGVHLHVAW